MQKNIEYYKNLASSMRSADVKRDELFTAMENEDHATWKLTPELEALKWVLPHVNTDPRDSNRAMSNILSGLDPKPSYMPVAQTEASKARSAEIERMLVYWWKQAGKRRKSINITRDICKSAGLYDAVIIQPVYTKYQKKIAELSGSKEWKSKAYGPFVINLFNPKDCHFRFSNVAPEQIVVCQQQRVYDVIDYWGDRTKELDSKSGDFADKYNHVVTTYDYWDWDKHVVWVENDGSIASEIMNEEHKLPFFPWIIKIGGSQLDRQEEFQYNPLNRAVYEAGLWEMINIVGSLAYSAVITTTGGASERVIAQDPSVVRKNYADPSVTEEVPVPPGTIEIQDIPQRMIDRGLVEILDRISMQIQKATMPKILQDASIPPNTDYASINQSIQIALGQIKPYRELAEQSIAEVMEHMLRWIKFTGGTEKVIGSGREDAGKEYILEAGEINDEYLCINVTLTPDVPTDKQQKINAGAVAIRDLGFSQESVWEDCGVQDTQRMLEQSTFEKLYNAEIESLVMEKQGEVQLKIEAARAQIQAQTQMAIQQQQMQAQQEAQQNPQGGQGFNPAAGGQPPAMANPGATRTQQTGMTQQGEAVQSA